MTYEAKPNTGTLWKNDRKEKDTHPDYRGSLNVDGHEYEISAWIKEGKKGKFMSLAIKEPYQKDGNKGGGANTGYSGGDLDDSIPFTPEWR